jgi:hypothetical protein
MPQRFSTGVVGRQFECLCAGPSRTRQFPPRPHLGECPYDKYLEHLRKATRSVLDETCQRNGDLSLPGLPVASIPVKDIYIGVFLLWRSF